MATQALTQAQAPLTITQALPLARSLARREAHHPDDVDDLVQVAIFAFHRAAERTPEVDNQYAHARTVLQRAMWGYYSGNGSQFNEREFVELPDESHHVAAGQLLNRYHIQRGLAVAAYASLDGSPQDGTQVELFELQDYFDALERCCGRVAREMAVNLISPTGKCSKRILDEAARKQRMQQRLKSASIEARRGQPRGVQNEIRLSQRVVRNALGLSPSEWNRTMDKIKEFTRGWLQRDKQASAY